MMIALLALMAALQTQPAKPVAAPPIVIVPVSRPAPTPPLPAETPPPAAETADTSVASEEPAYEAEPELPTRQVCRYVQVTGQRFPVRSCRTVTIYPNDPA
jgi:hypothetical protein